MGDFNLTPLIPARDARMIGPRDQLQFTTLNPLRVNVVRGANTFRSLESWNLTS